MAALVRSILPTESAQSELLGFRARIVAIYAFLIAVNLAAWIWAFVAFSAPAGPDRHRRAGLQPRAAPCDRCRPYRCDRQCHAQADAGGQAAGRRRLLFRARTFDRRGGRLARGGADGANALSAELVSYREIGGIVGTSASALFLFIIAIANLIVLRGGLPRLPGSRRGEAMTEEEVDALLHQRGWLARLFRPLFRFVAESWHLYPIGLLFALGFETASEISLFGLSAQASDAVSSWSILVFPALFAAGMTLVDTTDGVLMLGAYGWAYRNPIRKLFYNLTITSVSVLVACGRRHRNAGIDRKPVAAS